MSWYEEITCTTVDKFIDAIDRTRSPLEANPVIYRGLGDSEYELKPTLYRKPSKRVEFEFEILLKFMLMAQRTGLVIPPDAMSFAVPFDKESERKRTTNHVKFGGGNVEEYDVGNIAFAMARHAGIPTRHLDFTWDPLVAAFIALDSARAADFDECRETPEKIAVWALNYFEIRGSFGVIHHDWTHIPSLRNQQGLFVFDPTIDVSNLECWTNAPIFEERLSKIPFRNMNYRITLTYNHNNLGELWAYLLRRNISKSTMFPTYDNVRHAVMSRYENPNPEIIWDGSNPSVI